MLILSKTSRYPKYIRPLWKQLYLSFEEIHASINIIDIPPALLLFITPEDIPTLSEQNLSLILGLKEFQPVFYKLIYILTQELNENTLDQNPENRLK